MSSVLVYKIYSNNQTMSNYVWIRFENKQFKIPISTIILLKSIYISILTTYWTTAVNVYPAALMKRVFRLLIALDSRATTATNRFGNPIDKEAKSSATLPSIFVCYNRINNSNHIRNNLSRSLFFSVGKKSAVT